MIRVTFASLEHVPEVRAEPFVHVVSCAEGENAREVYRSALYHWRYQRGTTLGDASAMIVERIDAAGDVVQSTRHVL